MTAAELHDLIDPFWRELRGYAQRLVADLDEAEMVAQPVEGVIMNHPAWILGHLGAYAGPLAAILRGDPAQDPIDHPFGRASTPSPDRAAYPSRDDLLRTFIGAYDTALDALAGAPDARLDEPPPIDRWAARFPANRLLPAQFIVRHNAVHLGQLSAWRRAMGRPPV